MRSRPDRPPFRARRRLGFTLIEVLIALSLLSILMVVLTSAMRAMGQTEERVDQRIAQAFAFLAVRVLRKMATSSPDTTGAPALVGGGQISRPD